MYGSCDLETAKTQRSLFLEQFGAFEGWEQQRLSCAESWDSCGTHFPKEMARDSLISNGKTLKYIRTAYVILLYFGIYFMRKVFSLMSSPGEVVVSSVFNVQETFSSMHFTIKVTHNICMLML